MTKNWQEIVANQLDSSIGTHMGTRRQYTGAGLCQIIEAALQMHGLAVVDVRVRQEDDPLTAALRRFLEHTRPPSGAFGQSMSATMEYEAIRGLRAAAARHLLEKDTT